MTGCCARWATSVGTSGRRLAAEAVSRPGPRPQRVCRQEPRHLGERGAGTRSCSGLGRAESRDHYSDPLLAPPGDVLALSLPLLHVPPHRPTPRTWLRLIRDSA